MNEQWSDSRETLGTTQNSLIRKVVSDLQEEYIILRRPLSSKTMTSFISIIFAASCTSIIASSFVRPNFRYNKGAVGSDAQHILFQGLKFKFENSEIFGSLLLSLLLSYGECKMKNKTSYIYCSLPWLLWCSVGMCLKEIPNLFETCFIVIQYKPMHGVMLLLTTLVMIYAQLILLYTIWRRCKIEIHIALTTFFTEKMIH